MAEAETTEIESITSESEEEGPSSPAKKLKLSQKRTPVLQSIDVHLIVGGVKPIQLKL